jgi:hypothetical protein
MTFPAGQASRADSLRLARNGTWRRSCVSSPSIATVVDNRHGCRWRGCGLGFWVPGLAAAGEEWAGCLCAVLVHRRGRIPGCGAVVASVCRVWRHRRLFPGPGDCWLRAGAQGVPWMRARALPTSRIHDARAGPASASRALWTKRQPCGALSNNRRETTQRQRTEAQRVCVVR